ncbi:hypothetical protein [Tenacibaculum sp. Bg11-29]|uniref:hypothetical protein n=1 Tax=Tenacibaculum sp. Bg11-29 TaxID=2058306 RepID=UPI0012FEBA10|nr:hypothetical protein [Tenacibaculum sp. Bg11-29]
MKKIVYSLMIVLFIMFANSCGKKMTFEDQIKKDVYEKISNGYCKAKKIAKNAKIKNLTIGEITPIGDTGMIDVSLEFDVIDSEGVEQHIKEAMLYLEKENKSRKMLAIFCDYDYRH